VLYKRTKAAASASGSAHQFGQPTPWYKFEKVTSVTKLEVNSAARCLLRISIKLGNLQEPGIKSQKSALNLF